MNRSAASVVLTLALLVGCDALACGSAWHSYPGTAGTVNLINSGLGSALGEAAAIWNNCGDGMPNIVANGTSGISITVLRHSGASTRDDGACGQAHYSTSFGVVTGGTIEIWDTWGAGHPTLNGQDCTAHFGGLIAHELGHVFGLDNIYDSSCYGYVMGSDWKTVSQPHASECSTVAALWTTPEEQRENCELTCNQTCTASSISSTGWSCPDQPNPPVGDSPGDPSCSHGCSPLVLDLNGDGIHTTSVHTDPVLFDLTGDGHLDLVGWTHRSTEEGLLYYDHNQNRIIDGGAELFGQVTVLPDGRRAEHGFEALAAHDDPAHGGNGDHVISPADRVWGRLRLWVDRDHDGVMTNDENYSLGQLQVIQLNLGYEQAAAHENYGLDIAGNYHFYRGTFVQRTHGLQREAVRRLHDVYFAVKPWDEFGTDIPPR